MTQLLEFAVAAVTTLFVIVEPIGVVPTFAALTAGRPSTEVRPHLLRGAGP